MLIYNTMRGEALSLKIEDMPAGWVITTDRQYFQQADVVVFYLPKAYRKACRTVLRKSPTPSYGFTALRVFFYV